MEFMKYQHIEKIGKSSVEGILNGEVYLFYKLDGTNASIWLKEDGVLGFGSRNKELREHEDNYNFYGNWHTKEYATLYKQLLDFLTANPQLIIYGEWLVPVNLKTYDTNAWKQLYVFDVYDTVLEKYLPYEVYVDRLKDIEVKIVPPIATLTNPTVEDIKQFLDKTGDYLVSEGLGEGIVIKNYNWVNRFGNIVWGKMLTEDFIAMKHKKLTGKDYTAPVNETPVELKIADMLTEQHINKEIHKLAEKYGEFTNKNIGELINIVFHEFWLDNWEIILKKFSNPTINFKLLRSICADTTRAVIFKVD